MRKKATRFNGNVLWFVFGGFFSGLGWLLSGIIWCITVIGIPFGKQFFKIAKLSRTPFGAEVVKK
ncbi:MAG: hypothetical protein K6G58_02445 [Lachnospiraceae bacterium]|nr:hypothetical protein [Lachnospiraceae bacterium]